MMIENKQTAVEFLLEKYKSQNGLLFPEDFKQAKEMEKEQNQLWWSKGWNDGHISTLQENTENFKSE
jgi:hypothetical protein